MFSRRIGLRAEIDGLRDVIRVAQGVVASLDLDTALDKILHSAMEIMAVPAGSVALFDERTREMQLRAHAGLSNALVANDRWQVVPEGFTERILRRSEPVIVGSLDRFREPVPWPIVQEQIKALITIPLTIQQKIVGILYLNDFVPRRFPARRLRLLPILASFAAMSIDNARLHQQMHHLASTDGLTGLFNHRRFRQQLQEEVSRASRYGKRLSIIMLDLDDFKLFNDTHGHPLGDEALLVVADALRQVMRQSDLVFRYGGEEFIIILPETDIEEALNAAERVRAVIEEESQRRMKSRGTGGVTASLGVASFPRDGIDPPSLLRVVDLLLYQAKKQGKNKVHHLPDSVPSSFAVPESGTGDWGCQSP